MPHGNNPNDITFYFIEKMVYPAGYRRAQKEIGFGQKG
jgi:hypothetical protein